MNNTFLALGDSYTIGEAVKEEERWPVLLVRKLQKEGISIAEPEIIATTGWTTDELQAAIQKQGPLQNYDLVSLLIGVNNQYRGFPIENYRKEFNALLEQAIGFAAGKEERVVVLSIPDYGVTPFAADKNPEKIARELDEYNQLSREISEKRGVKWFDITPGSRLALKDDSLIAEDGLHPSGKMYRQWVDQILPYVVNLLRNH